MTRLPDFRIETWFSRWEFVARYNLAASDMESHGLEELLALADDEGRAAWASLRLGYIPTLGTPALRTAIAATYETLDADDVLCFAGAEEGIFCAMQALLEPGDHAVVLVPNYQSMEEVPRSLCAVTGVPLHVERGWAFDPADVRAALRPNTKLVAVNFPNNPTGQIAEPAAFDELIRLTAERGIWLFSDEVYRGLERPGVPTLPAAADRSDQALSLGVMSKAYGLAGLRIGWIACRDRQLLSRMERVKHYLSIANAGPSELLATIALRAGDRILARNRRIIEDNLPVVERFMEAHAGLFEWDRPPAGCIAFPRYRGSDGCRAFCEAAAAEGVLLLPGDVYRSSLLPVPEDRFRLGFGRRDLPEALGALEAFLAGRGVAPRPGTHEIGPRPGIVGRTAGPA